MSVLAVTEQGLHRVKAIFPLCPASDEAGGGQEDEEGRQLGQLTTVLSIIARSSRISNL